MIKRTRRSAMVFDCTTQIVGDDGLIYIVDGTERQRERFLAELKFAAERDGFKWGRVMTRKIEKFHAVEFILEEA